MGFLSESWKYVDECFIERCISTSIAKFYLLYHLYHNEKIKELEYDFKDWCNKLYRAMLTTGIELTLLQDYDTVINKTVLEELIKSKNMSVTLEEVWEYRHDYEIRCPFIALIDLLELDYVDAKHLAKDFAKIFTKHLVNALRSVDFKKYEFLGNVKIDSELIYRSILGYTYIEIEEYYKLFIENIELYMNAGFPGWELDIDTYRSIVKSTIDDNLERLINGVKLYYIMLDNWILKDIGWVHLGMQGKIIGRFIIIPLTISTFYKSKTVLIDQLSQIMHMHGSWIDISPHIECQVYKCIPPMENEAIIDILQRAREGLDKPKNLKHVYYYLKMMNEPLPKIVHEYVRMKIM